MLPPAHGPGQQRHVGEKLAGPVWVQVKEETSGFDCFSGSSFGFADSRFTLEKNTVLVVLQRRRWFSPVGEVQNGLDGVSTSCADVPFKSRQQRNDHKHPELLLLTATKRHVSHCNIYPVRHSLHTRFSWIPLGSAPGKQPQYVNRIHFRNFIFLHSALSRRGSE